MTHEPPVWRCEREICKAGRLTLSFDKKNTSIETVGPY